MIVIKKEQCVGILTERDLIERTVCRGKDPKTTKIKEIMSFDVKSIHPLDKIEKAIEEMKKNKIKNISSSEYRYIQENYTSCFQLMFV